MRHICKHCSRTVDPYVPEPEGLLDVVDIWPKADPDRTFFVEKLPLPHMGLRLDDEPRTTLISSIIGAILSLRAETAQIDILAIRGPGHAHKEFPMTPQKIVILRHGEKPGDPDSPDAGDPDLAPPGVRRAQALADVIPKDFGKPDFLVAAASSDVSHRPVETLQPLANSLGFGDDHFIQSFANHDYAKLARDLLSKSKFASKLVIVCWHHGNIPQLATALGVTTAQMATAPEYIPTKNKWNSAVFDRFWILAYANTTSMTFHSVAQNI